MRKIIVLTLVLLFFTQIFPVSSVYSQALSRKAALQNETALLRVVIVLDVSGSMDSYSFGGSDLPVVIADLKSKMDDVLNSQTHRDLLEQKKQLQKKEEIVNASRVYYGSYQKIEEWYSNNGYGSISDVQTGVSDVLTSYDCDGTYNYWITIAENVQEVEERISYACSGAMSSEIRNAVLEVYPIENEELSTLIIGLNQAEEEYNAAYDTVGLTAVDDEIYTFLDNQGYYSLEEEMYNLAPSYSLPTKMDLAKQAAQILVELSKLDALSQGISSEISVVTFSNTGKLQIPLTSDFEQVDSIIQGLDTENMTNISGGLEIALDQVESAAGDGQPSIIIILSDGYANRGMVSLDMLNTLPEQANSLNTSIYTVGVGATEYDVDSDLLIELAEKSGGGYLFAQSGEELVNFFIASRQQAVGASVTSFTGSIQQGERQQAGSVPVDKDLDELSLTLSHLEGDLTMRLIDPDGEEVTTGYPGMSDQTGDNVQLIKIKDPKKGNWLIEVEAESVPSNKKSVIYTVVASQSARKITPTPVPSATPTPSPSFVEQYKWYLVGGGVCVFGVVALIAVVVVVIVLFRRKQKK